MTAVSADNTVAMQAKRPSPEGMYMDYPVAAATAIHKNTFVGLNASGYLTSYVAPAGYTGFTNTGTSFRGIAVQAVASQTSNGDATCRVLVDGYFTYALSGVAVTDVGCPVVAIDNSTLSGDITAGHLVGHIVAYDRSGYCTVKLNPYSMWGGKMLTVVSTAIDFATANQKITLVHGTDNHNGLLLHTCGAYTTEVHAATGALGIVTIQHDEGTTDVSMGCTITVIDNMANLDLIVGIGGAMLTADHAAGTGISASNMALVKAPAGYNVNAEVTTASEEAAVGTGQCKIMATLFAL